MRSKRKRIASLSHDFTVHVEAVDHLFEVSRRHKVCNMSTGICVHGGGSCRCSDF